MTTNPTNAANTPVVEATGEQWWYEGAFHVDLSDLADQIVCDSDTPLSEALVFNTKPSRLRVPQYAQELLASINEDWCGAFDDHPGSMTSETAEVAHKALLGALEKCRPIVYSADTSGRIDMTLHAPAGYAEAE